MKKNKITSYILYALGEILLVVIGILIAVQFNNRNNQWKLTQTEKLSLNRLAEDLQSDINRYDYLASRLSERMDRCDSTIILFQDQKTIKDRLEIISIHQINFFLVEPNTTTYDEMLNTGRLYSLNDKTLRSEIINYYRQVNKWGTYIEKDNFQLRTMMTQPIYNDYWVIQQNIWNDQVVSTTKYPWLSNRYSREMNDIEALTYQTGNLFQSSKNRIGVLKKQAEKLYNQLREYRTGE